MKIGEEIKKRRKARGLSQASLGQMLGVSGQQISNIERGYAGVSLRHSDVIVNTLGIPERLIAKAAIDSFRQRVSLRK